MSGEIVVDASLALKWVLEEPYSADANNLLENWGGQRNKHKLLAPALFLYELPTLSRSESSASN
jgi:predicted nucleic acid-binding protein